jgi:hypothetical protein
MRTYIVSATVEVDKQTGKKKIVGLHFPSEEIRKLTDKDFLKRLK